MTDIVGTVMPDNTALTAQDRGCGTLEVEEEPLHVLDLPQLHTRPPASALLSALADLSSAPRSWDGTLQTGTPRTPSSGVGTPLRRRRKVESEGVPSYLTKIVASSLAWIDDDEQKEQVWEAASQRLSERSGRSAMSAIDRTFAVPLQSSRSNTCVELVLHEPALTGDSLGHKTWASSFLLAKRMCTFASSLPHRPDDTAVLELGSGTGLVGLAAAAVLQASVVLTDLPDIVYNLEMNVRSNFSVLAEYGAKAEVAVLDWSRPHEFRLNGIEIEGHSFPLIVVADPIYNSDHPRLLTQAINCHLSRGRDARVVLEMPLREGYSAERDDFRNQMESIGLANLSDGEETGFDDWSSSQNDELSEVHCWWSVWGWI